MPRVFCQVFIYVTEPIILARKREGLPPALSGLKPIKIVSTRGDRTFILASPASQVLRSCDMATIDGGESKDKTDCVTVTNVTPLMTTPSEMRRDLRGESESEERGYRFKLVLGFLVVMTLLVELCSLTVGATRANGTSNDQSLRNIVKALGLTGRNATD